MNEFKTDIESEKQSIEMKIMRIQSQIGALKESKTNLTKMATKLNELAAGCDEAE